MVQEVADIIVREKGARVVKRRFEDIADSATNATRSLRLLQNGLFVLGGAGILRGLVNMLDTLTNFENRLRLVTASSRELESVQQSLFEIAKQTRSGFESTAEVFTRTALSVRQLGIDQQQTLQFTESLNKAVILSGASAREANAAIIQLSQGLASDRLSGDELRSVLEQLPFVADVIAKSLGVTRGELRQMGRDGKIAALDILEAFEKARVEIDTKFAETIPTVGQAFEVLRTSVLQSLDSFDDFTSSSELVARAIIAVSESMDELLIIVTASAIGFAAFKFAPYIQAAYAAVAATVALSSQVKAGEVVLLGSIQAENLKAASLLRSAQAENLNSVTKIAAIKHGITQLQQNAALLASQKAEQSVTIANGRARSLATGQYVALTAAKANLNRTTAALILTERALRASKVELSVATATQTAATTALAGAQIRATAATVAAGGIVARLTAAMPLLGRVIAGVTIAFRTLTAAIIANPIGALIFVLTSVAIGFGLVSSAMAKTESSQVSLTQSVDEYLNSLQDIQRSQADVTRGFRDGVIAEMETATSRITELQDLITNNRIGGHQGRNLQINRNKELEDLIGIRDVLTAQLENLTRILEKQETVEERVLTAAEHSATTRISRTLELAAATREGGDAVASLNNSYRQTDALVSFRSRLEKAGLEAAIVDPLVRQMAEAMEELQEAAKGTAVQDASEQIFRMRQELSALKQGASVLDDFNRTFSQLDAIRSYRSELTQAGVETGIIETLTTQFTNALIELDQTTRALTVDKAIADVTAELDRMNAEAVAISQGQAAYEAFKQTVGETAQLETFRQRLEEAGVTGSRLEGIINALTNAIFRLNSAAGQARIDTALEDAATAVSNIRRETAALAGGEDAFKAFENARSVETSVNNLRTTLEEAGVAEGDITAQLGEHRTAMEGLISERDRYNETLRTSNAASTAGAAASARDIANIEKFISALRRENEALTLNSFERRIQEELIKIQNRLKRELTDTEEAHIRSLLRENEILKEQQRLFGETADAANNFEFAVEAIGRAFQSGQIGQQQYISLLRQTRIEFLDTQTTMAAGLERGFLKALETSADYATQMEGIVTTAFDGMTNALAEFVTTGKTDFASLIQDINQKIIKLVISQAFQQLFGGMGTGEGGGGFFSGLLQGIGSILGAKDGAQFTVGQGNGMAIPGVDNRLLAMRVQDGETVTVTPKGQRASGGGGQTNNITFNIQTPDVQGFQNSESQIAAKMQRAISRGGRNS